VSEVKKLCKSCMHYQAGEFPTSAGRVIVRSCRQPIGEFFMQIVGPLHTCDKYAYTREGVHDGRTT
jgi:hypothetical protein